MQEDSNRPQESAETSIAVSSFSNFKHYIQTRIVQTEMELCDVQLEELQGNLDKMLVQRSKQQQESKQIMSRQGVRVVENGNDIEIDLKFAGNQMARFKQQIKKLESQNKQLKTQCTLLREKLEMYEQILEQKDNKDQWPVKQIEATEKERISGETETTNQRISTTSTLSAMIEQKYICKLAACHKENQQLVSKISYLEKQVNSLHQHKTKSLSLETTIIQLQKSVAQQQKQIAQLNQQLAQSKESVSLLQIPIQVIYEVPKMQICEIPVYIEKEIIRQVHVPLYINSNISDSISKIQFAGETHKNILPTSVFDLQYLGKKGESFESKVIEEPKESASPKAGLLNLTKKQEESLSKGYKPRQELIEQSSICFKSHSSQKQKQIHLIEIPSEIQFQSSSSSENREKQIYVLGLPMEVQVAQNQSQTLRIIEAQWLIRRNSQDMMILKNKIQQLEIVVKRQDEFIFGLKKQQSVLLKNREESENKLAKLQQQYGELEREKGQLENAKEVHLLQMPVEIMNYGLIEIPIQLKSQVQLLQIPVEITHSNFSPQESIANNGKKQNEKVQKQNQIKIMQQQTIIEKVQKPAQINLLQVPIENYKVVEIIKPEHHLVQIPTQNRTFVQISKPQHHIFELPVETYLPPQQSNEEMIADLKQQNNQLLIKNKLLESQLKETSGLYILVNELQEKLNEKENEKQQILAVLKGKEKKVELFKGRIMEMAQVIQDSKPAQSQSKTTPIQNIENYSQMRDLEKINQKQAYHIKLISQKLSYFEGQIIPQFISEKVQLKEQITNLQHEIAVLTERLNLVENQIHLLEMPAQVILTQHQLFEVPVEMFKQSVVQIPVIIQEYSLIELPVEVIQKQFSLLEIPTENIITSAVTVQKQVIKQEMCVVEVPIEFHTEKETFALVQIPVENTIMIEQGQKQAEPVIIERIKQTEPIVIQKQIIRQIPVEIVLLKEVPIEIEKPVYIQVPVHVVKEVEVPKIIERIVEKEVLVEVVKQIIKEVPVYVEKEVIREIEVQKQIIKEIIKEVQVQVVKEVPVQKQVVKEIIRQVIKEVPVQVRVEVPIQVEKQKIIEMVKEVPIEVQIIKQKIVEVEKPVIIIKQIIKQIPIEMEIQIIKQVPVEIVKIVEKSIEIIKNVEIIKEVPVEVQVQVTKEVIVQVQKPVEVIKEVIKEVRVEVQKPIQIIKYVTKNEQNSEKPLYHRKSLQSPEKKQIISQRSIGRHSKQFISQISTIQVPTLEFPSQIHNLSNPSSQRSQKQSEGEMYNGNDFYNNQSGGMISMIQEEVQVQHMIQKYQQREKQLLEQNQYLVEQIQILGGSLSKQRTEIEEYRRDLYKAKQDYEALKQKLQERNFTKNKSMELESKLKIQIESKYNMEKKIRNYEIQIEKQRGDKVKIEKEVEGLKSERRIAGEEIKKLEKQLSNLQRLYEQKSYALADVERDNRFMKQLVSELQERSKESSEVKNSLEEEIAQLKNQLYEENHQRDIQNEETRKFKQLLEENERVYKKEATQFQKRYTEILNEYQSEINKLNNQIQFMKENEEKLSSGPSKIEDTSLIRRLEEENDQLRKVVEILNVEIINVKRKNQIVPGDQLNNQDQNTNNNNLLKSISFSNENRTHPTAKKKLSKIRIEDIKQTQSDSDIDTIERLTNLVNQYSEQLEQKDKQISQLNKVINSYEQTIQRIEGKGMASSQFSLSKNSIDKQTLNMNVYVSNILRKLSVAEENLNKEKSEKMKYSMRIKQLQKQLESEAIISRLNGSYEQEDSQLLEQLVYELENEKNKNQMLMSEIAMLRQQVNRLNKNSFDPVIRRQNYLSFDSNIDDEFSLQLLDTETLLRQVKIYKAEYYKALDTNRQLKSENKILKEKLRDQGHCSAHIETISYLSRKVEQYQKSVIPRLKEEIKKIKDNYSSLSYREQLEAVEKFQQPNNFLRREDAQNMMPVPMKQKNNPKEIKLRKKSQSVKEEVKSNEINKKNSSVMLTDNNLQELMKMKMSIQLKYIMAKKLIQLAKSVLQSEQIESLSPERILVLYFSAKSPSKIKLAKASFKSKSKDKIKFYQAPEVLVGQSQSEKSLVWTIGVIIDQFFVGKNFYQKFAQILGPKNNYYFRLSEDVGPIGKMLERMIIKDKNQRAKLSQIENQLAKITFQQVIV